MIQVYEGDGVEPVEPPVGYPDLRRVRTMLSAIFPHNPAADNLRHLLTRILAREASVREFDEVIWLLDPCHWKLDPINSRMIADARDAARCFRVKEQAW